MKFKKFLPFILLLILPLLILATKQIIDLRKGAAGIPANISVDTKNPGGNVPTTLWQNLSQGGEEPVDMIKPVIGQIKALSPKLIRIDHIFDFYKVDQGNNNYDFSQFEQSWYHRAGTPRLEIKSSYQKESKDEASYFFAGKSILAVSVRAIQKL